jgi:hypothetical protein
LTGPARRLRPHALGPWGSRWDAILKERDSRHFTDFGQALTISRCAQEDIRINANLFLYPPELDVRVARQSPDLSGTRGMRERGPRTVHYVRHGGGAASSDSFVQVLTHWRVRAAPCDAAVAGTGSCPGGGGVGGETGVGSGGAPGGSVPGPIVDWHEGGPSQGPGAPGELLEVHCSQLSGTATADQLARCQYAEGYLTDMPAGVPPVYGQIVRVTGASVEQPSISVFPVARDRARRTCRRVSAIPTLPVGTES